MADEPRQANIPPDQTQVVWRERMAQEKQGLLDSLVETFQARMREFSDPAQFPDTTWAEVEKARQQVAILIQHHARK